MKRIVQKKRNGGRTYCRLVFREDHSQGMFVQNKRDLGGFPAGPVLRICPPVQGTKVPSLVWEDPTCHGATKALHHSS